MSLEAAIVRLAEAVEKSNTLMTSGVDGAKGAAPAAPAAKPAKSVAQRAGEVGAAEVAPSTKATAGKQKSKGNAPAPAAPADDESATVKAAIKAAIAEGKQDKVIASLAEFGATNFSTLAAENYADFLASLDAEDEEAEEGGDGLMD